MSKMLIGAFADQTNADRALRELEGNGYTPKDISVISSSDKYKDEGYETGTDVGKSALGGATTGGVIGGLAGLLAGVGVMPAIAGLFIGGPIAAALGLAGAAAATASGAVTGAAAGGLIGALMGLGISKETATSYDSIVKDGGVVLGLTGRDEMTEEAQEIMERNGAQDVSMVEMHQEGSSADEAEMDRSHDHATDDSAMERNRSGAQQPAFGEQRDPREAAADRIQAKRDDMTDKHREV